MNQLELLANLKLSISNAKYCNATPEYKAMAIEAELDRAEHIIDKLLGEYRDENRESE
jgi:hypothetical protein